MRAIAGTDNSTLNGIDWVICGGESGYGARYMDQAWAYSLREQCVRAGTKFFMKQMHIPKKNPIPPDLMTRDYPIPRVYA
jgi:protein gp37